MTCTSHGNVVTNHTRALCVIKDEQPAGIMFKPALHSTDSLALIYGVFLWQIQIIGKTGIIISHHRRLLRPDPPDDPVIRLVAIDILHSKLGLAHAAHTGYSLFPRGKLS